LHKHLIIKLIRPQKNKSTFKTPVIYLNRNKTII